MKKTLVFLHIVLLSFLLLACSNPQGGFGPSWDITAQVPLLEGNEDNTLKMDKLLSDLFTGEIGESGELVKFQEVFNGSELKEVQYDIGAELIAIDFPVISGESLDLEVITLEGFIDTVIDPIPVVITPGLNGSLADISGEELPAISLGLDYDLMTFANGSDPIVFSLSRESNDVIIEKFDITISYNNGAENEVLSFDVNEINSLPSNQSLDQSFLMEGLVLTDKEMEFDVDIRTSGPTDISPTDDIELSIILPDQVGIESVENLDVTDLDINYQVAERISLNNLDIDSFIKQLAFANGELSVHITDIPGLEVKWNSFEIGSLQDLDNDGLITLDEEVIDFGSSSFDTINFALTISKDDSNTLTYNAADAIDISGGFSNDTTIDYLVVDFEDTSFARDSFDQIVDFEVISIDVDSKLKEELNKIDFYPEVLAEFMGLDGLIMDFEKVVVKALDTNGDPLERYSFNFGLLKGENPTLNLMDFDPNILDLIKNPDTAKIIVEGTFEFEGGNVQIESDSVLGLKGFTVELPFEVFVSEDIIYDTDPQRIGP
ncbi:MAG: hypothetical protein ACOCRU_00770, partial [bacterium]